VVPGGRWVDSQGRGDARGRNLGLPRRPRRGRGRWLGRGRRRRHRVGRRRGRFCTGQPGSAHGAVAQLSGVARPAAWAIDRVLVQARSGGRLRGRAGRHALTAVATKGDVAWVISTAAIAIHGNDSRFALICEQVSAFKTMPQRKGQSSARLPVPPVARAILGSPRRP
jgi:hypothetical protein